MLQYRVYVHVVRTCLLHSSMSIQGPRLPETFVLPAYGSRVFLRSCTLSRKLRGKEHGGLGIGDFSGPGFSQAHITCTLIPLGQTHRHTQQQRLENIFNLSTQKEQKILMFSQQEMTHNTWKVILSRSLKKNCKTFSTFEKKLHMSKAKQNKKQKRSNYGKLIMLIIKMKT